VAEHPLDFRLEGVAGGNARSDLPETSRISGGEVLLVVLRVRGEGVVEDASVSELHAGLPHRGP